MWRLMGTLLTSIPHQKCQLHSSGEIVSLVYTFEAKIYKVPLPDQDAFYVNIQYFDYVIHKMLTITQVLDTQTRATMDYCGLNNKQLIPRHTKQGGVRLVRILLCYTALMRPNQAKTAETPVCSCNLLVNTNHC